jgi:guanyl-specific ribonuclease Sa
MPNLLRAGLLVLASLFGPLPDRIGAQVVELTGTANELSSTAITERAVIGFDRSTAATAPQKAYDVLAELKRREGKPLRGYVGGQVFHNHERRLPLGLYREYDVDRKIRGRSRGPERLVIEQTTGKAYYTSDHYRSFIPLN